MFKKIIITLLLATPVLSMGQQAEFHKNIAWKQALKMAKAQNKYIFVDAYTDWCYWCKVMDKNTFTNADVISALKDNFIAVKIDAEKGEGIDFAAKFKISGYPTVLFFNPEGMLVKKQPGYLDAPAFLQACKNTLASKETIMDGTNLSPGFPEFYLKSFDPKIKERATSEEIKAFLDKQDDLTSEVAWAVMFRFPLNEKYTGVFLAGKDEYAKKYGKEEVSDKIQGIASNQLRSAIKNNSDEEMNATIDFVKEYFDEANIEQTVISFWKHYFQGVGQWRKFAELVNEGIREADPNEINSHAWNIYEKCDDEHVINMACDWMDIAVKQAQSYALLDTYAAILYKAKRYEEAEQWAVKAIDQGEKEGEKVEGTEKLLEDIRAKK